MDSENRYFDILLIIFLTFAMLICLSACAGKTPGSVSDAVSASESGVSETYGPETGADLETGGPETGANIETESSSSDTQNTEGPKTGDGTQMKTLKMKIGGTPVAVDWEENESVAALAELVKDGPLTVQTSMYGGFEQVGPLGTSLPRNDVQTRTQAGDIVLYSGDQIVVFYGSNSWAYTRLGHISDKSASQLKELLGNGDVTVTIVREG